MSDRDDAIDPLAHLAEEIADDLRREAVKTGRTVRTTPKPDPKGGDRGKRR